MAAPRDVEALTALLGRAPLADFDVVLRDADGRPVVVRNAPFTVDGTPMPTRYWLVDRDVHAAVSRLEAAGGDDPVGRWVASRDATPEAVRT